MKTEAGRLLAERVNLAAAEEETRLQRLSDVLYELWTYQDEGYALTDAAIGWAFTYLAFHKDRQVSEDYFYAIVNEMYSHSAKAESVMTEMQREQLSVASLAVQQSLIKRFVVLFQESHVTITGLGEDNYFFITADVLWRLRDYLEHADPECDKNIIIAIYKFSKLANAFDCGVATVTRDAVLNAASEVAKAGMAAHENVSTKIQSGRLAVVDGKIIKPVDDGDDDEWNEDEDR